jgi:hypothetical protein
MSDTIRGFALNEPAVNAPDVDEKLAVEICMILTTRAGIRGEQADQMADEILSAMKRAAPELAASATDYPAHWPREVRDACQDAAQQAPEDRSFFARTIKYLSDECLQLRAECDRETDALIQLTIQRTLAYAQNPALPLPTVASVRAAVKELGE